MDGSGSGGTFASGNESTASVRPERACWRRATSDDVPRGCAHRAMVLATCAISGASMAL